MRIFWIFIGICLKVMFEKKKYLNIKSADHGFLLNKIENEGNMVIFIHTERIMLSDFYKFPIHDPFLYFSFRFRNF